MFDTFRNDASQSNFAAKYREGFMPYRGGYVFKPFHNADPIQITEAQREQLVEAYCVAYRRAMWVMMPLLLLAMGAVAGVSLARGYDMPDWGFMLTAFLVIGGALLWQRSMMRQAIARLGPYPSALGATYGDWQRQRLRDRSWLNIVMPIVILPAIVMQWHTHLPPRDFDDYFVILLAFVFIAVTGWAAIRKWRAGIA